MSFTSNVNKTNHHTTHAGWYVNNIFNDELQFNDVALKLFHYQHSNNKIYKNWCDALQLKSDEIGSVKEIPFLPISFFKSHKIVCEEFEAATIFESSGTTQTINSKHFVKDIDIYKKSFLKAFELFYGDIKNYCILGLLPSYLERKNSSLVMMVDELIQLSGHPLSGFYLHNFHNLHQTLQQLENAHQKTILIGVTFALLDFASQYPTQLKNTVVMETGGMKGRREELTRQQVHEILEKNFGLKNIHSEYGMTELLSQAYAKEQGKFFCPPWMKVFIRDETDPRYVTETGKGILNIIDLANIHSCAFIATDDTGQVFADKSFEVMGRLDKSDLRGCSLLTI